MLRIHSLITFLKEMKIHASGRHGELVARIYSSERNCILLSMKNGKFEREQ